MNSTLICNVPDCEKTRFRRGYCAMHVKRFIKHGDPLAGRTPNGERERFIKQVVLVHEGDECLIWPYGKSTNGYITQQYDGRQQYVHRIACEALNGPPPSPDMLAAHSCGKGSESCVNRNHLRWATEAENHEDMVLHGTIRRGEQRKHAVLTEQQVREMKGLFGTMTRVAIAERYGVAKGTIANIARGINWAWVK